MGNRINKAEFDPYKDYSGQVFGFMRVDFPTDVSTDGRKMMYSCTCLKCNTGGHICWMFDVFHFRRLTCDCSNGSQIAPGMQMGVWTVLEQVVGYQNRHPSEVWVCQRTGTDEICDCSGDYLREYSMPVRANRGYIHEDITGQMFGSLKAVRYAHFDDHNAVWRCECQCTDKTIVYRRIKDLKTQSNSKMSCWNCTRMASSKYTHDELRLYCIWKGMKKRCYNQHTPAYAEYGGRGITICDDWMNPRNFINWAVSVGYNEKKHGRLIPREQRLSIDRIDVNGNYEPNNCRWITLQQQSYNTRMNLRFVVDGHDWCAWDWAYVTHQDPEFFDNKVREWGYDKCLEFIDRHWDRVRMPYAFGNCAQ